MEFILFGVVVKNGIKKICQMCDLAVFISPEKIESQRINPIDVALLFCVGF